MKIEELILRFMLIELARKINNAIMNPNHLHEKYPDKPFDYKILIFIGLIIGGGYLYFFFYMFTSLYIWIPLVVLHIIFSFRYLIYGNNKYLYGILLFILLHGVFSAYDFPLCSTYGKAGLVFNTCECRGIIKRTLFEEYCIGTRNNCYLYNYNNDFNLINKTQINCSNLIK